MANGKRRPGGDRAAPESLGAFAISITEVDISQARAAFLARFGVPFNRVGAVSDLVFGEGRA